MKPISTTAAVPLASVATALLSVLCALPLSFSKPASANVQCHTARSGSTSVCNVFAGNRLLKSTIIKNNKRTTVKRRVPFQGVGSPTSTQGSSTR